MITEVTCPQFSTAILQRARLKSEGIKLALGKNQSLGLWANRRRAGSNSIPSFLPVIQAQSLEALLIAYQGDHFCMRLTTHANE